MTDHDRGCACRLCDVLQSKTKTTEDWRAEHQPHLAAQNEGVVDGCDFAREAFEHPSGDWYWLACPCGAKHLTMRRAGGGVNGR